MPEDELFRRILIAGLVTIMPLALYHRIRSQASGESLDRTEEGLFILLTLRPLGMATMIGLIAWVVSPATMAWASMPLPTAARWLGVGLGAAGGALLLWSMHTLGPNLTDTVVTREGAYLVTGGPYRWVRHPFYSATALAVTANGLVTANGFLLVAGIATFALIVLRTRREEELLVDRFGEQYRDFMARTGRFWPRWSDR